MQLFQHWSTQSQKQQQLQTLLRTTILGSLAVIVGVSSPGATIPVDSSNSTTQADAATKATAMATHSKLPLSFETNVGQFDQQVNFLARGSGYSVFLTPSEAVLTLRKESKSDPGAKLQTGKFKPTTKTETTVLRLQLVNSNLNAQVKGLKQLPSQSNYLIGNDPKQWHTDVSQYASVQYQGVYQGIDLVYYGNQGQLEYDFVVAPGANPENIRFQVAGASRLEIDAEGNLLLHTPAGAIRQHKPVIYQVISGKKKAVAGGYVLLGQQKVAFKVAAYDKSQPLVIDPVISYSTYLGGNNQDYGYAITVDSSGNAYVTGRTYSTDFPTKNFLDNTLGNLNSTASQIDVFVTKLNLSASGSASLVYSTYLGGKNWDIGYGIAVDKAGNAYVTGSTYSTDFPTKNAFDSTSNGADVFVTKLNATGNALVYSTYLGGRSSEEGSGITVDKAGNAYLTGTTTSGNFPVKNAYDSTYALSDAFVTKLNATGNALLYSTFFGGSSFDDGYGIAVDSTGYAYVTGRTTSSNFPIKNAFDSTHVKNGTHDAFVSKLNPSVAGSGSLVYSSYLGGELKNDQGYGIAVDSAGNAYVTGRTQSSDFPTKNAFDSTLNSAYSDDAFVTKVNPATSGASSLVYSSYLGGNFSDFGHGIAVDLLGNAYVTGYTSSTNFPTKNAFDSTDGFGDAFVTKVNPSAFGASSLVYSSYLGGEYYDYGHGIAVDSGVNAYVTGYTRSTNFPTKNAFDSSLGSLYDAFVTKISP